MNKVYFPNCNGLRWIASIFVIVYHIEQVKSSFGLPSQVDNRFLYNTGTLGIISFFVLSGFLITYLLLKEKESTGVVSFKNFYIRRILRIWPLYFLIIGLSLFILPKVSFFHIPGLTEKVDDHLFKKSMLFLFMLPNVVLYRFGIIPFASQTWSIGVEEQCYILWPLLINRFKNISKVFLVIIVAYFIIKAGLFAASAFRPASGTLKRISYIWGSLSIDCMAMGGIAALVLYHDKKAWLNFIFHKYTQVGLYIILTGMLFLVRGSMSLYYGVFAALFAVMILNLAANKNSLVTCENRVFNYMGKISYGLYMYHVIAIVIMIRLTASVNHNNIAIYAGVFVITILLSVISYELFEKKFLVNKKKYSFVVSGDNVSESAPLISKTPVVSTPELITR